MTDLFLTGCLRHGPLLETLLGRVAPEGQPAQLPDHALHWTADLSTPVVIADKGQAVPGVLLRVSEEELARLDYFQGAFGLHLAELQVEAERGVIEAQVFLSGPGAEPGPALEFDAWQAEWGAFMTRVAVEAMGWYGRLGPEGLRSRLRGIRLRAAARTAISAHPDRAGHDVTQDVNMIEHRFAYADYFGMEEALLQFRRYDGSMSAPMARSCLATGRASVILPYDPVRDSVLLIEQFRAPLYLGGDPAPWLWEPIAGMIDPGETPEQAALREAEEEAGVILSRLETVGAAYSSSGSSMEYCHLFVGLADLGGAGGVGGLASEGEDIRSAVISFDDLMEGIDRHLYRDMPLLVAGHWLARHRDRLRAES